MPQKPAARKSTQKSTKSPDGKGTRLFSAEEREAIRDYVREKRGEVDGEDQLRESIARMPPSDRAMAERVHAIVRAAAPSLEPRTWYGMPAYAKDGSVICFFQPGQKFKTRYATLGFSDKAKLDEGNMWPNGYALTKLTDTEAAKIRALVKRAVS